MNAADRLLARALITLWFACGVLMVNGCTPAQIDAFDRSLDRVRELAGDVCLEHDGWEACLKKCEAEKERRDAAPAGP